MDGDDPAVERPCRDPQPPLVPRLYFFRNLGVDALWRCVKRQAHGCLDKQAPAEDVLRAVRAAESNLFSVAPALLRQALRGWCPAPGDTPGPDRGRLTSRQQEVVAWAARGLSNKQIARQLGISPETVKCHLQHAFEREGVRGRVALVAARHDGGLHLAKEAAAGLSALPAVRNG